MAHHLTPEERERLCLLKAEGRSQASIARVLGRSPSTISRELCRNDGAGGYTGIGAQLQAELRRSNRPLTPKMEQPEIRDYVRQGLAQYWSPEQIAGRACRDFPDQPERHVSYQTIYDWIDDDPAVDQWKQYLRHRGRKRALPEKRGQISNRTDVDGRPAAANQRLRYGDWEGDTVVSRGGHGGVLTLVERRSRYTLMRKVSDRKAPTVRTAAKESLEGLPDKLRRTLTFDNGKEFAEHEKLSEQVGIDIYFAKPYASWQRGTNENTNGLLRQFHPKGTDFSEVRPSELVKTQNLLNNRPRKCLDYRTPAEVLEPRINVAFEI